MFDKHKNGLISELIAEQFFINKGHGVFRPNNNFCRFDMVVDDGEHLKRIQVKSIYFDKSKNRYVASCATSHLRGNGRRTNKKYGKEDFDLWVFVSNETKSIYIIPSEIIAGRRAITFYPNGKPETVNNRYADFELYKVT